MYTIEWISLIGLCTIVILTVIGNFLILFVILIKQRLRSNVTNRLIGSLAAADLLLGVVVMPFAVVDQLRYIHYTYVPLDQQSTFDVWIFGQDWCDLWHAFDVLSSTASILNLCVISLERYIAISDPFNYPTRMTHSKSICMIFTVWICSAFISFPAIIWWRFTDLTVENTNSSNTIGIECIFSKDTTYLLLSSSISFYIPLIVMVVVYCRIYRTAQKLLRTFTTGQKFIQNKTLSGDAAILRVHRGGTCKISSAIYGRDLKIGKATGVNMIISSPAPLSPDKFDKPQEYSVTRDPQSESGIIPTNQRNCFEHSHQHTNMHLNGCFDRMHELEPTASYHGNLWQYGDSVHPTDLSVHTKNPISEFRKRFRRFVKDRKAAKTLGIVMGVFILCWLPFFIYNTLKAIYPMILISQDYIIFPLVTWLGYINSTINPVVYAFSLKDFQKALFDLIPKSLRFRRRHYQNTNDSHDKRRKFAGQIHADHLKPYDSLVLDISDKNSGNSGKSSPRVILGDSDAKDRFNFTRGT